MRNTWSRKGPRNLERNLALWFIALACAFFAMAQSACKEPDNFSQNVGNDWIDDSVNPTPPPSPGPTPVPSPVPTPTPLPGQLYIGPAEVERYVVKFVDDAKIQGVDVLSDMDNPKLEIRIASLDAWGSTTIGLCETGAGKRLVTFDPDFWNRVSETQKELLAHHEFGHCVLYRPHRTALLSGGAYASIMYPIIMSSSMYTGNYAYYQNELFTWGGLQTGDGESVYVCGPEDAQ